MASYLVRPDPCKFTQKSIHTANCLQLSIFCKNMSPISLSDRLRGSMAPDALRSYLAEFISTFFFVLVAVGSAMSARKLMPNEAMGPSGLLVSGIANAFALSSAVYVASSVSGGHVNPAVTFGMAVAGRVSIPTALCYWISQLLASVMACLALKVTAFDQNRPIYAIAEQMTGFGASVLEGVLTFALVYTVFAASDPRRGQLGAIGSLAIGFTAGANVLVAGPFSGGATNPICAFGSAVLTGRFKNQAVYWVGPLLGGSLAGLLYDNVVFPSHAQQKPTGESDEISV